MIKAVIFDAFEVIFLNASGHFFDKYVQDKSKLAAFIAVNQASDRNELTYHERIQGLADVAGESYEFINEHLYEDLVRNERLINYIDNLRNNYKIALLSNTGEGSIEQFMSETELNELFDEVVLSYKVGYVKPDKDIFDLTAKKLGVRPEECVFVDDSQNNCEGAEATGMKAILYNDFSVFKNTLERMI